jgi:hypothetical protein
MTERRGGRIPRLASTIGQLAAILAVSLWLTAPTALAQVMPPTEENRWREAEDAGRAAAERLRAGRLPEVALSAPPVYPADYAERQYPWELLGSPFIPVMPLGEIRFMSVPPSPDDPDSFFRRVARQELSPLGFRLNYPEARPYLDYGRAPLILEAWAQYLGRPPEDLPRLPITPERTTLVIGSWLREAGYLVGPMAPSLAR